VEDVTYLADKSALARVSSPTVGDRITELFAEDQIVTCGMVDLELLYSAQNGDAYDLLWKQQMRFRRVPITEDVLNQALALQRSLAGFGKHRRPIPDLIIAAAALLSPDVTVLHYDSDFDVIAEVCELRHEWVVPRGSL
jgi:predicted nucleic acid-binding protein